MRGHRPRQAEFGIGTACYGAGREESAPGRQESAPAATQVISKTENKMCHVTWHSISKYLKACHFNLLESRLAFPTSPANKLASSPPFILLPTHHHDPKPPLFLPASFPHQS